MDFIFPEILGISSSQLTHIFQRGGPGPPTSVSWLTEISTFPDRFFMWNPVDDQY